MGIPLAPIERMLKRSNMRVSESAVKEMAKLTEEIITDLSFEAVASSRQAGRKTLIRKDIEGAKKKIFG